MSERCEWFRRNSIGLWFKPWFYKHVQSFLNGNADGAYEYVPLRHYYHRHTRSIFWTLSDIIPFGNHPLFRWLFGWMVPPKIGLLKLTQGETIKRLYEKHQIIQDMLVPIEHLESTLDFLDKELKLYPLWLCPLILEPTRGLCHSAGGRKQMFVDIGTYGPPRSSSFEAVPTTRRIEEFVRDVGGFQMLYADCYQTEEEFRAMFDHRLYDDVRKKWGAVGAFPQVYDKVSRAARQ